MNMAFQWWTDPSVYVILNSAGIVPAPLHRPTELTKKTDVPCRHRLDASINKEKCFVLTGQDDLLGHQTPTTFDHVVDSDPSWMERYWYTGHRIPQGDVIFEIGLGLHPNKNVMDAYVGITIGSTQRNLRLSRRARPDPLAPAIGPLRISVIDGLKTHRLTVDPNDSGISMDLQFTASMNPHEESHHFGWPVRFLRM